MKPYLAWAVTATTVLKIGKIKASDFLNSAIFLGFHDPKEPVLGSVRMISLFPGMRSERDALRAHIIEELRRALPDCSLAINDADPLHLSLGPNGKENRVDLFLHNIVQDLQRTRSPGDIQQRIAAYVHMARQSLYPPKLSLDRVYLGLRHRGLIDQLGDGTAAQDPLVDEGPGDLNLVVLHDVGDGVGLTLATEAEDAGFTVDQVTAAAERNLLELLPDHFFTYEPTQGLVALCLEDFEWLSSSLILAPKLLDLTIQHYGWQRALVAVPTRDGVVMADADSATSLPLIERWILEQFATDPRRQSEILWTHEAGSVVPRKTHRMFEGSLIGLS